MLGEDGAVFVNRSEDATLLALRQLLDRGAGDREGRLPGGIGSVWLQLAGCWYRWLWLLRLRRTSLPGLGWALHRVVNLRRRRGHVRNGLGRELLRELLGGELLGELLRMLLRCMLLGRKLLGRRLRGGYGVSRNWRALASRSSLGREIGR